MHIVYVTREYPPCVRAGGIGSYVKEIATGMVALGHKVTVITASDDTRKQEDYIDNGVSVIRLSGGDFSVNEIEPSSNFKKLRCVYRFHSFRRKIRKAVLALKDVDIIEVADFGAEGLYLDDIGIPVVIRLHTPSFLNIDSLSVRKPPFWKLHRSLVPLNEIKILKRARYISSCSTALLAWLHENIEFRPEIETVICNPFNINSVDIEKHNGHVLDTDSITIFSAGTISDTKGVPDLVEACRNLIKEGINLNLYLAGKEGAYACNLKQEMKQNNESRIHFLGKLKREDLYAYYANADICCFPSWWENMPMVCLEAMACGGIVIGSTSGGMKEIITDGVDGFLVPRKSPELLAEKIKEVLQLSDAEKKGIRSAAAAKIKKYFGLQTICEQMIEYYKQVCHENKCL